jgi:hypothetical protein
MKQADRPRCVSSAIVVNVLTLVPAVFLVVMYLLGASSTVQFNVGSPGAMRLWALWGSLWPLFLLLLGASLVVAALSAVVFLVLSLRRGAFQQAKSQLVYVGLTVAHCLFTLNWVWQNFPSA